jgi:hypothetical protein
MESILETQSENDSRKLHEAAQETLEPQKHSGEDNTIAVSRNLESRPASLPSFDHTEATDFARSRLGQNIFISRG